MGDKPLSVTEAAEALRVHPNTVRNLERRGRFPRARRDMNNRRFYTVDDVRRMRDILYPPIDQAS